MISNRRAISGATFAILAASVCFAQEGEIPEYSPGKIALNQLFSIDVTGTTHLTGGFSETGTAFAIAPNALVTAAHVVGNPYQFRSDAENIYLPMRDISVRTAPKMNFTGTTIDPTIGGLASNAPIQSVDAALVEFPNGVSTNSFPLSACNPQEAGQGPFHAVLFHRNRFAQRVPILMELSYDETTGSRLTGAATFVDRDDALSIRQGDSGAPVINAAGEVIGLVSQRGRGEDTQSHVYVTLTGAFLTIIPDGVNVDCTDRDLKDRVETLEADLTTSQEKIAEQAQLLEGEKEINIRWKRWFDQLSSEITNLKLADTKVTNEVAVLNAYRKNTHNFANITIRSLTDNEEFQKLMDSLVDKNGEAFTEAAETLLVEQEKFNEDMQRLAMAAGLTERPLFPAVSTMQRHLSREHWDMIIQKNGENRDISLTYDRNFAVNSFSDSLAFCMAPLLPQPERQFLEDDHRMPQYYDTVSYATYVEGLPTNSHKSLNYYCWTATHVPLETEADSPTRVFSGSFRTTLVHTQLLDFVSNKMTYLKSEILTPDPRQRIEPWQNWNGMAYLAIIKPQVENENGDVITPEEVVTHYLVDVNPSVEKGYQQRLELPCMQFETSQALTLFLEKVTLYPNQPTVTTEEVEIAVVADPMLEQTETGECKNAS